MDLREDNEINNLQLASIETKQASSLQKLRFDFELKLQKLTAKLETDLLKLQLANAAKDAETQKAHFEEKLELTKKISALESEVKEQNTSLQVSLQELKLVRERALPSSKTTTAYTGSFCTGTSCSINVSLGTYAIIASFVCKDTAGSANFWVYYNIQANQKSILPTSSGHYVPIISSQSYPYQVTLHAVTPSPFEGTITLVTTPWQNTQYGSFVLTVIPTILN